MLSKTDIKYLVRSGSLRFMRDSRAMGNGNLTGELNWNGHPVYYRAGSSDCEVLYKILLKKGKKGRMSRFLLSAQSSPGIQTLILVN